ncbi:hypothetical protein BJ742DRAFT_777918 [Cladochytrium replicatum]|nr:hypothetical protein BJ742DRAFT_777918 [Cladochytrium replicatum]
MVVGAGKMQLGSVLNPLPLKKTLTYKVAMSCTGCSGAVDRILKKNEGVDSYEIKLDEKLVIVNTALSEEQVTAAITESGKETTFLSSA